MGDVGTFVTLFWMARRVAGARRIADRGKRQRSEVAPVEHPHVPSAGATPERWTMSQRNRLCISRDKYCTGHRTAASSTGRAPLKRDLRHKNGGQVRFATTGRGGPRFNPSTTSAYGAGRAGMTEDRGRTGEDDSDGWMTKRPVQRPRFHSTFEIIAAIEAGRSEGKDRCQRSDVGCQTSDIGNRALDVRRQTTEDSGRGAEGVSRRKSFAQTRSIDYDYSLQ